MSLQPSAIGLQLTAVLAAALIFATTADAQVSPYAGERARELKALSDEEVASLLDGAGMRFALPAELNGVPGPRHSLDMADQLALDAAQRERLRGVFDRMSARARELGAEIVAQERELDALFASGAATAYEVERRTMEIAVAYGHLRAAHLVAHLETKEILSEHQIERYAQLRGYAAGEHGAADEEHGAHD